MNRLPLDLEPNFQDAELYKAFSMAIMLLEGADSEELRELAEQTIESLVIAWAQAINPTEH